MGFLDEPIRTAHAVVFGVPAQGGLSSVPIFYTAARSCELAKLRWYLNTLMVMKSDFTIYSISFIQKSRRHLSQVLFSSGPSIHFF